MATYKTEIPDTIVAGYTLRFAVKAYDLEGTQITFADGYTAYLILTNDTNIYSATSMVDVDQGFLFDIASNATTGWTAGDYSAVIYVDDATDRYHVTTKFIQIKPNLDGTTATDVRSLARQIRDALEAAILGSATNNQLKMSIAGRAIERMSLEDLMTAKSKYDGYVAKEDEALAIIDGKPSRSVIRTRFI